MMRAVLSMSSLVVAWMSAVAFHLQADAQRASPREHTIELRLTASPPLTLGDRAEIIAHVELSSEGGRPLLVTPTHEGTAIEVVRGRLTRGDAAIETETGSRTRLRFRIPVVARTVGTGVLRVRVDGFRCRASHCEALQIEESLVIEVRPSRDP